MSINDNTVKPKDGETVYIDKTISCLSCGEHPLSNGKMIYCTNPACQNCYAGFSQDKP